MLTLRFLMDSHAYLLSWQWDVNLENRSVVGVEVKIWRLWHIGCIKSHEIDWEYQGSEERIEENQGLNLGLCHSETVGKIGLNRRGWEGAAGEGGKCGRVLFWKASEENERGRGDRTCLPLGDRARWAPPFGQLELIRDMNKNSFRVRAHLRKSWQWVWKNVM